MLHWNCSNCIFPVYYQDPHQGSLPVLKRLCIKAGSLAVELETLVKGIAKCCSSQELHSRLSDADESVVFVLSVAG